MALVASVILGICTLGILHFGCWIAEKCIKPVDKKDETITEKTEMIYEKNIPSTKKRLSQGPVLPESGNKKEVRVDQEKIDRDQANLQDKKEDHEDKIVQKIEIPERLKELFFNEKEKDLADLKIAIFHELEKEREIDEEKLIQSIHDYSELLINAESSFNDVAKCYSTYNEILKLLIFRQYKAIEDRVIWDHFIPIGHQVRLKMSEFGLPFMDNKKRPRPVLTDFERTELYEFQKTQLGRLQELFASTCTDLKMPFEQACIFSRKLAHLEQKYAGKTESESIKKLEEKKAQTQKFLESWQSSIKGIQSDLKNLVALWI